MDEQPEISDFEIEYLHVYGARVHNLKNIDVSIPRNKFVVITGISGSGKSSLAFDTIFAEGQRRYIDSFSAYARQFLGNLERPDVDKITGLSPVISIEQKTTNKNPRSTVGTITEVYDFMRLLFARVGEAYSHVTGEKMVRFTEKQIVAHIQKQFVGKKVVILAPLVRGRKGHYRELFDKLHKQGYLKVRVDEEVIDIKPKLQLDRYKIHDIEAVIDRFPVEEKFEDKLKKAINKALEMSGGLVMLMNYETEEVTTFSEKLMDAVSGLSYEEPSPNTFSFNSPYGACAECRGLGKIHAINMNAVMPNRQLSINAGGIVPLGEVRDNYVFRELRKMAQRLDFNMSIPVREIPEDILNLILYGNVDGDTGEYVRTKDRRYSTEFEGIINMVRHSYEASSSDKIRRWAEEFMEVIACPGCNGARLKKESLHFKIDGKNIAQLSEKGLSELFNWFEGIEARLSDKQKTIGRDLIKEIRARIKFLLDVGLDYLSIDRPSRSLSGGESQRIRLATQIGAKLQGITYILDEPSIGLHERDNHRLINSLKELVEVGNTVLVVEHDKDIMLASDYIIDIGPGAGELGGEIVGQGLPDEFLKLNTLTADYLSGRHKIDAPEKRRTGNGKYLSLSGAVGNNLLSVSVDIPLGTLTLVTGVSGSGKSTLINDTLYPILRQHLYNSRQKPLEYLNFDGLKHIDKVIEIDQSPIGRTPRSNPGTYIGVFSDIRSLFADLQEAKIRGYKPGRFSFNVKGGRCDECEGAGVKTIEMNFLPDVYVECPKCLGKRYNRETLEVRYKGKTISDVLDMPVDVAVEFFEFIPPIQRKLQTLKNVGLGYITVGQSSPSLSGGEAQRVKLASELSKKDTGQTFYILDEPTTGLHFEDIRVLLKVLQQLVDKGNTVLIIEHNMDVIKVADYIIDLGPEGGHRGGRIIAKGTPEEVAQNPKSYTGQFLKEQLKKAGEGVKAS